MIMFMPNHMPLPISLPHTGVRRSNPGEPDLVINRFSQPLDKPRIWKHGFAWKCKGVVGLCGWGLSPALAYRDWKIRNENRRLLGTCPWR